MGDPGRLIAFEGVEGSGKSTQLELLRRVLEGRGREVVVTREPGGTPAGERVRAVLLDPEAELHPRAEALLFAAARAELVEAVIRPALERGAVVLCDRYLDSSLAYQGAGRALDLAEVEQVQRWATRDLRPHLTVVLDLAPEQGLGRFAERDRIEGESVEFHERVRKAFVEMASADPDHYLVMDARRPVDDLATEVRHRVQPLLVQAKK